MTAHKLPRQPEVNIGTAGHVDHGKTTLVEAITGVWTSAHSEELRRGITIRVGYADAAFYRCPSCPEPQCYSTSPTCPHCGSQGELLRVVSFVDCPGHGSLMANMLSGAAVMDGAILVVAANEKVPQPQTREHLQALQMLGMTRLVVAHNKVDLLEDGAAVESLRDLREFVKGTVAEGAPIVPVSGQHRLNIDALIMAIEQTIPTPPRSPGRPLLMDVLRSFDVNRPGTPAGEISGGVVGGTIMAGELTVDTEVEIRPGVLSPRTKTYEPITTRVTGLMTGAGKVDKVSPGGLVAIGTSLDPSLTKSDSLVGSMVGMPGGMPPVHSEIRMTTMLFDMVLGAADQAKVEKIRSGDVLRLNIGTATTLGNVVSATDGLVVAELKRPVCARKGSSVAISRRIADRWRLIGAGVLE